MLRHLLQGSQAHLPYQQNQIQFDALTPSLLTTTPATNTTTTTGMDLGETKINGFTLATPMDLSWADSFQTASSSVTGTSELFSSTFAVLSDAGSFPDPWVTKQEGITSTLFAEQPMRDIFQGAQAITGFDSGFGSRSSVFDSPMPMTTTMTFPHHIPYQATFPQQTYETEYRADAVMPQSLQLMRPKPMSVNFGSTMLTTPQASPIPLPNTMNMPSINAQNAYLTSGLLPQRPPNPVPVTPSSILNVSLALTTPSPSSDNPALRMDTSSSGTSRRTSTVSPGSDPALISPKSRNNMSENDPNSPDDKDGEGGDEERVMCAACRGVYPSRRSLTGHIGRNEKCREIIGRNYLDQVAQGGNPAAPCTESAIKAGAITNGQDGMSPICPYCDRFISHYKGNIRRHINQCTKNVNAQKRPRIDKEKKWKHKKKRDDDSLPASFDDDEYTNSFMSSLRTPSRIENPMTSSSLAADSLTPTYRQPHDLSFAGHSAQIPMMPSDLSPPSVAIKKEAEIPDDAYICMECDFVTIYKGNMKRHLNTCHPAPDCKDLKEWDRKLEALKASVRGITREELQDKLNAHKMNSTRGRKPRGKKGEEQVLEMPQNYMPSELPVMPLASYDYMSYAM